MVRAIAVSAVALLAFAVMKQSAGAEPLTVAEADRLSPDRLARRLLEALADDAVVTSSFVGKPALSTILQVDVELRQRVEQGPVRGLCRANVLMLGAANIGGPDTADAPLTVSNATTETLYRIVGRVPDAPEGDTAMGNGDPADQCRDVRASDPMFRADDRLFPAASHFVVEGIRMLQTAMDRAGSKDKARDWLECPGKGDCAALLASLPVSEISQLRSENCWTEGAEPVDPLCVQFQVTVPLKDPKPTSHSWSSIVVTLIGRRPEPFGPPRFVRAVYSVQQSIV